MLYTNKRRDWDLNPGEVNPHGISSPAPYQARLSRHTLVNISNKIVQYIIH